MEKKRYLEGGEKSYLPSPICMSWIERETGGLVGKEQWVHIQKRIRYARIGVWFKMVSYFSCQGAFVAPYLFCPD